MPGPVLITPTNRFTARRKPIEHACDCGHREMIVPPCGEGVIIWVCSCGQRWRIDFKGSGFACGETILKGVS